MESILLEFLVCILVAFGTLAMNYAMKFLDKHKILSELKANEAIIRMVVKAVQESSVGESGANKFKKAKSMAIDMLKSRGLSVNEVEIEFLIDSVVKELKKEFGESWKEVK